MAAVNDERNKNDSKFPTASGVKDGRQKPLLKPAGRLVLSFQVHHR